MGLTNPKELLFERTYTSKFVSLASPHGVSIKYDQDIAAIDLGIHLASYDEVTDTRIWFQLKGLHKSKLSVEQFHKADHITYKLDIKHIRAWYSAPEPVYLVVYIEATDIFLAEDISDIVKRQWRDEILNPTLFKKGQKQAVVKIPTDRKVEDTFWTRLLRHRSMRIDGVAFRGRPLGHSHDPLTSTPRIMPPELFTDLVNDLLMEHGYRIKATLDAARLFPTTSPKDNIASLSYGMLHHKFEIVLQITNEFLSVEDDGFREEGASDYAQGLCAVLIHSKVASPPSITELKQLARELVEQRKIPRLLVFVNGYMLVEDSKGCCFAEYNQARAGTGIKCTPQHLEDIGFNLCTTTNTYLRFRDKVSWWGGPIWDKEEGPFFTLPADGGSSQRLY